MAYSKQVIERFEGVLNSPEQFSVGRFDPNDPNVATGMTGAPACGDVMKLQLKLNPDTNVIEDVKFKTYGCGSAIASSTMFVDMLKGLTIEEAKKIKDKDIADALELPPIKLHCSVLAEDSIRRAIQNWEEK
jgi:nitrogen fixation NifU-like protein